MKRWLALLLTIVMLSSSVNCTVFAEDLQSSVPVETTSEDTSVLDDVSEDGAAEADVQTVNELSQVYVNPLYADVVKPSDLNSPSDISAEVETLSGEYYTSVEEAGVAVRNQLKQRIETIEIGYTTTEMYTAQLMEDIIDYAMLHTGNPKEGDYLRWQYAGYVSNLSGYSSGGTYYLTVTYTVTYYTTAEQETAMDQAVAECLNEVQSPDQTVYEKVSSIYEYICNTVSYDNDNLYDDTYKLKYTAYAALINKTAVCQGYAVLFYRLALEEGIDTRLIVGIGNGGSHAWNIVRIGDYYYNLDATWDATLSQNGLEYEYFLRNDENFVDHAKDEEYLSEAFVTNYPIAENDYDPNAGDVEPKETGEISFDIYYTDEYNEQQNKYIYLSGTIGEDISTQLNEELSSIRHSKECGFKEWISTDDIDLSKITIKESYQNVTIHARYQLYKADVYFSYFDEDEDYVTGWREAFYTEGMTYADLLEAYPPVITGGKYEVTEWNLQYHTKEEKLPLYNAYVYYDAVYEDRIVVDCRFGYIDMNGQRRYVSCQKLVPNSTTWEELLKLYAPKDHFEGLGFSKWDTSGVQLQDQVDSEYNYFEAIYDKKYVRLELSYYDESSAWHDRESYALPVEDTTTYGEIKALAQNIVQHTNVTEFKGWEYDDYVPSETEIPDNGAIIYLKAVYEDVFRSANVNLHYLDQYGNGSYYCGNILVKEGQSIKQAVESEAAQIEDQTQEYNLIKWVDEVGTSADQIYLEEDYQYITLYAIYDMNQVDVRYEYVDSGNSSNAIFITLQLDANEVLQPIGNYKDQIEKLANQQIGDDRSSDIQRTNVQLSYGSEESPVFTFNHSVSVEEQYNQRVMTLKYVYLNKQGSSVEKLQKVICDPELTFKEIYEQYAPDLEDMNSEYEFEGWKWSSYEEEEEVPQSYGYAECEAFTVSAMYKGYFRMRITVGYYNEQGYWNNDMVENYVPEGMTYQQFFEQYVKVTHYAELEFQKWNFERAGLSADDEVAEGNYLISAIYKKKPIQVSYRYYDKNGWFCFDQCLIAVEKDAEITYAEVREQLGIEVESAPNLVFYGWTYYAYGEKHDANDVVKSDYIEIKPDYATKKSVCENYPVLVSANYSLWSEDDRSVEFVSDDETICTVEGCIDNSGYYRKIYFVLNGVKSGETTICMKLDGNVEQKYAITVKPQPKDAINLSDLVLRSLLIERYDEDEDGCLNKDEMEQVYSLYSSSTFNLSIKSLDGLEYAKNLSYVNLSNHSELSDIDALFELQNLENVDLTGTAVSDEDRWKLADFHDMNLVKGDRVTIPTLGPIFEEGMTVEVIDGQNLLSVPESEGGTEAYLIAKEKGEAKVRISYHGKSEDVKICIDGISAKQEVGEDYDVAVTNVSDGADSEHEKKSLILDNNHQLWSVYPSAEKVRSNVKDYVATWVYNKVWDEREYVTYLLDTANVLWNGSKKLAEDVVKYDGRYILNSKGTLINIYNQGSEQITGVKDWVSKPNGVSYLLKKDGSLWERQEVAKDQKLQNWEKIDENVKQIYEYGLYLKTDGTPYNMDGTKSTRYGKDVEIGELRTYSSFYDKEGNFCYYYNYLQTDEETGEYEWVDGIANFGNVRMKDSVDNGGGIIDVLTEKNEVYRYDDKTKSNTLLLKDIIRMNDIGLLYSSSDDRYWAFQSSNGTYYDVNKNPMKEVIVKEIGRDRSEYALIRHADGTQVVEKNGVEILNCVSDIWSDYTDGYRAFALRTDGTVWNIAGIPQKILNLKEKSLVIPKAVTNMKAVSAGKNQVKLTWTKSEGADGYLIYAQKNGKYGYCGMTTTGTTFTDKKALDSDYNFYWVFPYVKDDAGKMHAGSCTKYVFAKGVCPAVTNLKSSSVTGGVKLTWSKSAGADGYLIYGQVAGKKYGFVGMTTTGTTYTDKKASKTIYNYYWVFPYHKDANGKMIVGGTAKYVYGRAK